MIFNLTSLKSALGYQDGCTRLFVRVIKEEETSRQIALTFTIIIKLIHHHSFVFVAQPSIFDQLYTYTLAHQY